MEELALQVQSLFMVSNGIWAYIWQPQALGMNANPYNYM